jgi:hypothetical protein
MDNIEMDVKETGCEDADWTHPDQEKVQWRTRENSNE